MKKGVIFNMDHLLSESIKSGDWKNEKHVPVITTQVKVKKEEVFDVVVSIGNEIAHPNTFEHHIEWIKVFFKPEDGKFPIEIGNVNFSAHGESEVYSDYYGVARAKVQSSGTIYALSFCNIHGLWQSSVEIKCE